MCVVSMVGDHYNDKWRPEPFYPPNQPSNLPWWSPTREEFDALKRDVEEMKSLLKRAKLYDEKNNEPSCEIEEKMEVLRKIAALVGVDLDDILKAKK